MNIRLKSKSLIDLTPVDSFRSYRSPSARRRANYSVFVYADTALCISTIVGDVGTLTLAFLLCKRVNAVQESLNKYPSGVPHFFCPTCIPRSSQVSNLFLPKLPCTRFQSVIEMMFVSCMCLFSLPLVPGPDDVPSGTSPSQRGICNICRQEFNCLYRSPGGAAKESASL